MTDADSILDARATEIETVDHAIIGEVVGVAQAADDLRKALDERQFEKAAASGYQASRRNCNAPCCCAPPMLEAQTVSASFGKIILTPSRAVLRRDPDDIDALLIMSRTRAQSWRRSRLAGTETGIGFGIRPAF